MRKYVRDVVQKEEECEPWLVDGSQWPGTGSDRDTAAMEEKAMSRDARMVQGVSGHSTGGGETVRGPRPAGSGEVRPAGSGPWSVYIEHETEPTSQSPSCSPQCDISSQHTTLP